MGRDETEQNTQNDDEALAALVVQDEEKDYSLIEGGRPGGTALQRADKTRRDRGEHMEFLVRTAPSDEEARDELDRNVSPERQAEALAGRGDLFSAAAHVVAPEVVVQAILESAGESVDEFDLDRILLLKAWAMKLKDRSDWEDVLNVLVDGEWRLYEYIVAGIYLQALDEGLCSRQDQNPELELLDIFEGFGINPADGEETLREMLEEDMLPDFDETDLDLAKRRLGEQFDRSRQRVNKSLAMIEAQAAEAVADEDEFDLG